MPAQEKYNLQRLLEMRERSRDAAALYLNECREQLKIAETELNARIQAVRKCRQAQTETQNTMIQKSNSGIKSSEIVRYRQHLADLRATETQLQMSVEEQKKVVERAEQTAEKALSELNEASKEVKIIEKHRENWQHSKKTALIRSEQKNSDEISALLHDRQRFE